MVGHFRKFRIVAKDPSLKDESGRIVTALVDVPHETLDRGPRGHRAVVVDFNATSNKLYAPPDEAELEAFQTNLSNDAIATNPRVHAQHTFAIVMRTLARFEFALGRRLSWGFEGQQLKIAPHAFEVANAFYSRADQALLFGYFRDSEGKLIFSCLAHDVVAHETTHALLDGLRERYMDPSHPDQAAFHEAFADIVAILSFFALPDVVSALLPKGEGEDLTLAQLEVGVLKDAALLKLGAEMGLGMQLGGALRNSVTLTPAQVDPSETEPHARGEVLVAAVINTFLAAWRASLLPFLRAADRVDRGRAIELGATIADRVLTTLIRALDYSPPVDVRFGQYLTAALTSSYELSPHEDKFDLRRHLREQFALYKIEPPPSTLTDEGRWKPFDETALPLRYGRSHFESLQHDPEEVFRFIWENREALNVTDEAYTRVLSVRPCLRIDPDGLPLRETIAEYKQILHTTAERLPTGVDRPSSMPLTQPVVLHGGGVLVFDQFGRLKYNISQSIVGRNQSERLKSLWERGVLDSPTSHAALLHLHRLGDAPVGQPEVWE